MGLTGEKRRMGIDLVNEGMNKCSVFVVRVWELSLEWTPSQVKERKIKQQQSP